ncbi:cell envelope integrity protein CreD [Psychrobacter arenosus]|uniref:cell envelope integrity protein CreD n=1 Tax=Psychrobacter arenosus TaxID=256326 RepID=UPI00191A90BD|nr:cell envelope integrity protein CreD [Psychrobacter arenosus]
MQKALIIKLSIIGGLCLIFAIGLNLMQSLVYERQQYSDTVVNEISSQHVNPQEVITPFIAVPTVITPNCDAEKERNCRPAFELNTPQLASTTQAQQSLAVSTDTYQRGIYHATSYQGDLTFKQQYQLSSLIAPASPPSMTSTTTPTTKPAVASPENVDLNTYIKQGHSVSYDWSAARLIIPVSDLRGVSQLPIIQVNGKAMTANYPITPKMAGLSYVEVVLPADLVQQKTLQITVELPLMGLSAVRTIPLGQQFTMTMASDWHAPNFIGQALPADKTFDNQGFQATWENQYLTVANNQMLTQCLTNPRATCDIQSNLYPAGIDDSIDAMYQAEVAVIAANDAASPQSIQNIQMNGFGVSFAEPNNIYLQTERAMKYALLLIVVSFGTFFLFEIIKSLRIHPIQYLLVGSALLVFYVLLLPLAEQFVFWQAYAIAATACVGLIGWYTYYVLNSVKRAAIFTAILGGLYAGFYGLLTVEDLNLLLGAIFCFVLIASVMMLTRKIDWYRVA